MASSHTKRHGGLLKQSLTFLRHLKGFTLIELLVVIAIVGLLSTVIASPIQSARKKARDAKKIAELKATQTALAQYAETNSGQYPPLLSNLYPLYMPQLPDFATTTAAPRDRFAYVTYATYAGLPTTNSATQYQPVDTFCNASLSTGWYDLVPKIYGYHIAVHLESYSQALDTDEDCNNIATTSPSGVQRSCYTYTVPNALICAQYNNLVTGMIKPYVSPTHSGEINGADTGTTTCSNVNDCLLDFSNHTEQ